MPIKLIGPARIYTFDNLPLRGALRDEQLEVLESAGVAVDIESGIIKEVGEWEQLNRAYPDAEVNELEGGLTLYPSWADCHTHAIYAGDRARDMALRNAGATYQQMAVEGGGIKRTMYATRGLNKAEMLKAIESNLSLLSKQGFAVVECKTGYGLTIKDEGEQINILDTVSRANSAPSTQHLFTLRY